MITVIFNLTTIAQDFDILPGWSSGDELLRYGRENLWEHINGAADQFLDLGFQQLQVMDFNKDTMSISVEIYDMGTELNAFGIYTLERSTPFVPLEIGTQAILNLPGQALLLKSVYYVKIYVFEGKLTESGGKSLLKKIAEKLPGENSFPSELNSLPDTGKLPGSEGYAREAFLGLNELYRCVYSEYEDDKGHRFKIFRMVGDSQVADQETFNRLPENWEGKIFKDYPLRVIDIPYSGKTVLVLTDRGLLGITDCQSDDDIEKRLNLLLSSD
jgi:hypothetical protein